MNALPFLRKNSGQPTANCPSNPFGAGCMISTSVASISNWCAHPLCSRNQHSWQTLESMVREPLGLRNWTTNAEPSVSSSHSTMRKWPKRKTAGIVCPCTQNLWKDSWIGTKSVAKLIGYLGHSVWPGRKYRLATAPLSGYGAAGPDITGRTRCTNRLRSTDGRRTLNAVLRKRTPAPYGY